jgi:hypothetical protein
MIRFLVLLLFTTQVQAWGTPATATTTVEARIVRWTENPCDMGDRYWKECDYARRTNMFPQPPDPDDPCPWCAPQTSVQDYE